MTVSKDRKNKDKIYYINLIVLGMKKPKYPYRIGIIFLLLTVPPIGATQLGWHLYDKQTGFDYGMIVGTVCVICLLYTSPSPRD